MRASKIELEFGVLVFVERGKPENPEKNPRSKDENPQQTQPTYDGGSIGIEPGPHWWEASALTTAPPPLPDSNTISPVSLFGQENYINAQYFALKSIDACVSHFVPSFLQNF